MSRVAYCSKCYRIVLADEVTGFDTCPNCNHKYTFTDINQHSWYLMTAEQKAHYKSKWFGSAHVANDTVRSFNEETGQEQPVQKQAAKPQDEEKESAEDSTPIVNNSKILMTKGDSFENTPIVDYLGIVSGSYVLSTSTLANIDNARELATDNMKKKCNALGANAVINVSVDTTMSDNIVILTTSGTAVLV